MDVVGKHPVMHGRDNCRRRAISNTTRESLARPARRIAALSRRAYTRYSAPPCHGCSVVELGGQAPRHSDACLRLSPYSRCIRARHFWPPHATKAASQTTNEVSLFCFSSFFSLFINYGEAGITRIRVTSNKCIAVHKVATPLRELTCHMGSHSVTCHPAEVTFPPLPQPKLVLD